MPTRRGSHRPAADAELVMRVRDQVGRRRRDFADGGQQLPVEVLERIWRHVHRSGGGPPRRQDVLRLMGRSGARVRNLWFAPAEFWSAPHRIARARRRSAVLRPEEIAGASWNLWVRRLTMAPQARWTPETWNLRIRNWCTEIARGEADGEHLLIAFVIAPGDATARLHAHAVLSFPPYIPTPDPEACASAWRQLPEAGDAVIAEFDPRKDGLRYMLDHGAHNVNVGCPRRRSCRQRSCVEADSPWIANTVIVGSGHFRHGSGE